MSSSSHHQQQLFQVVTLQKWWEGVDGKKLPIVDIREKGCSVRPRRRRVLAVRHGESEWNVLRKQYPQPELRYTDLLYKPDCSITAKGVEQSRQAGQTLNELTAHNDEDILVVVSPLRRALETAQNLLETFERKPQHILVHPACTEVMEDSCDIGTPVDELMAEFPQFDFSLLQGESSFWWSYGRSPQETWVRMRQNKEEGRELQEMALRRIQEFQSFLRERSEGTIVVVCHSETIWLLTSEVKENKRFGIWTENGEVLDITKHVRRNVDAGDDAVVVSLPFSALVSGERSCELPPRHVEFAILMDATMNLADVKAFFGATTSKVTNQSRRPWRVTQVIIANEDTCEQTRDLGKLDYGTSQSLPLPRLWQPDPLIEDILWPLLRKLLCEVVARAGTSRNRYEVWDLGSGAGRDVCFLAEQFKLMLHSCQTFSCRLIGVDHHKASSTRCIPFWTNRGVHPEYTEARLLDLRKLDMVEHCLKQCSPILCLYAVRFYEPKLIRYLATEAPLTEGTLFAMSHFCKATKGAEWSFDHPKEKSVLERDELATLFGSVGQWDILHDELALDGDHGRTLIQFVARRRQG